MFFSFFKRSKTRNIDKNEKQCSNEKQTLPDAGAVECVARKKEKFSKGTSTNDAIEKQSLVQQQPLRSSELEKTNHCANTLVSALHLNLSPSFVNDTTCHNNTREIHLQHGAQSQSVSPQPQYYYNNLRKQNDLCKVVEVNVYNNNSNKGDDDRQKNDNISGKGSIETTSADDSFDARTLDGARLSEPVSKFSPKLFTWQGKRGDKSSVSNFFNDFIMGKGRQRHRGARSNPVQVQPQQNQKQQQQAQKNAKNSNKQTPAHGSGVNDVSKNNYCNNGRNLPQNSTTLPEKRKNQGDKNNKSTETLNNVVRDDLRKNTQQEHQRGVVKNNTGGNVTQSEDSKNLAACSGKCSPDVNGDVVVELNLTTKENFHEETQVNASSFIHSLPLNEQGGGASSGSHVSSLLLLREDSNEFAPPEKKSKICETLTVNQSDNGEHEEAEKNLRENRQQLNSENCETDEMGQPNSKNGVNNNINESSANFNSTTSDVGNVVAVAAEAAKTNHQETMGTDDTIGGGQTQRATSPCGSNIIKSVRFNDENLCSYADDIFYEANDSATGLESATSLENLTDLPNYFNNSNSDDDDKLNFNSDKENIQKVPLVKGEDDDDDDDDEIPSTYEEAQSISVLVTDDEFFENIVQPLVTNNVQTEINNQENHEENLNPRDSAFNDDENYTNEEDNLKISHDITPKNNNNETSIYNNPPTKSTNEQEISDENYYQNLKLINENDPKHQVNDKNESDTYFTENCENIHSFNNHDDKNDEENNNTVDTILNNNKNLYMEDTISLPDIVESSHQNGIPVLVDEMKIDEKSDKMGNEM